VVIPGAALKPIIKAKIIPVEDLFQLYKKKVIISRKLLEMEENVTLKFDFYVPH